MQISQDINHEIYGIHSYTPGALTITLPIKKLAPDQDGDQDEASENDRAADPAIRKEILTQSVIIMSECLIRDWPPLGFDDLQKEHFDQLIEKRPEIVLFGSGPKLRWPDQGMLAALIDNGIGVEVMDTAAACRTYSILASDLRRVAAALIL